MNIFKTNLCLKPIEILREITVEPVLFLYMLSIFIQFSLFQDLIYTRVCSANYDEYTCANLHNDEDHTEQLDFVQKTTSHFVLYATLCTGIPSVFMAIYLGSWSDRFGKKWPVIIPPIGGILGCIVYIVICFEPSVPIEFILLASFLPGLTGGYISCISSCMTYVSAITSDEDRTLRIFRLEAMIYVGGTLGPFLSGAVLPYIGRGFVFVMMLGFYATAVLYTVFLLPNIPAASQRIRMVSDGEENESRSLRASPSKSLQDETLDESKSFLGERTPLNNEVMTPKKSCCRKYFTPEHFISAIRACFKAREGRKRMCIVSIIITSFVSMMITAGELDVAYLFAKDKPLVWEYSVFAYYLGFKFGLGAFGLLVIMPIFNKFRVSDSVMCIIGLVSRIAGLICFGLSRTTLNAFVAPVVSIFCFFTIPSFRSILSKLVSPHEQGKIFSFIAVAEDFCSMSATLLFNGIYPMTRPLFQGFIFQVEACILVIPVLIMVFIRKILAAEISTVVAPEKVGEDKQKEEIVSDVGHHE